MKMTGKMRRSLGGLLAALMLFPGYAVEAVEPEVPGEVIQVEYDADDHKLIRNGDMGITVHFSQESLFANDEVEWKSTVRERFIQTMEEGAVSFNVYDLRIGAENVDEINAVLDEVLNMNPQYFFVTKAWAWRLVSSTADPTKYVYEIKIEYINTCANSDGTLNKEQAGVKYEMYKSRLAEALACAKDEMTEVERLLAVHDWLVRECDYDYENYADGNVPGISHTAAGAFIEGKCVCDGYAQAMCIMLYGLGMDVYFVSSDQINHAWNIVRVDGNYYHVDATWDDPITSAVRYQDHLTEGLVSHDHFLKSDDEIRQGKEGERHLGWDISSVPPCTESGSYASYPFRTNSRAAYTYGNGWWYYGSGSTLYRTEDLSVGGVQSCRINESIVSAFYYGGALYYATGKTVTKVTGLDGNGFDAGVEKVVYDISEEHPGYEIQEFAIKKGDLVINSYKAVSVEYASDRIKLDSVGTNPGETSDPNATPRPTADPVSTPEPTIDPNATPEPTADPNATPEPTADPNATPEPTTDPNATPEPTADPNATSQPTATPAPTETKVGDLTYSVVTGKYYFYEDGEMARSKEAYVNGAWRWFDKDGTMAVDKDVYLSSNGGKWVRYNENGEMVKGEDYRYDGWYYFEPITGIMMKGPVVLEDGRKVFYDTVNGKMLKGEQIINGETYHFDETDGHLTGGREDLFWVNFDGRDHWYENWQRQGWNPGDGSYRGKEIYDPATGAWYWLDNILQGGKAAGKEVFQEYEDGSSKWVRYDENGGMVKGWYDHGRYYYDLTTGAMYKGTQVIEGKEYHFNEVTGILDS